MTISTLPFVRVLSRPRSEDEREPEPLRRMILAGLLEAAIRERPVASVWLRASPEAPLHVLIARDRLQSPANSSGATVATGHAGQPLPFPLGTTGEPLQSPDVAKLLSGFGFWTACAGAFEPLLADVEDPTGRAEQRWTSAPLDELVGYLSHEAFAWLVYAVPASAVATAAELDRLRRDLFRLRQSGQLSEADVISLERQQSWYRELSRAGPAGVWNLTLAVGSPYELALRPLAAMFCAAAEHSVSNYTFRPLDQIVFDSADDVITADNTAGGHGLVSGTEFRVTAELAAALIRPPEIEVPGLHAVIPSAFDVSLEEQSSPDPATTIVLGTLLDRHLRPAGDIGIGLDSLNRHTFVCGATGGGKSQSVRALLETLSRRPRPIPWMVIEPAKAEYARMAGRLNGVSDVLVIAPGDRGSPAASINPLEPASLEPGNPDRTFPLQSHADLVRALFLAAFQAEEPFPQVLSQALTQCYAESGWDLVTGEATTTWLASSGQPIESANTDTDTDTDTDTVSSPRRSLPRYPTLGDVQRAARAVVDSIGYAEDIKRNVRGFIDVRVGSLRTGTPGRLFEGGHPVDFAALLKRNVVIEAESITNDQDKAFVIGVLLIRLYEQLLLEEKERFSQQGTPGTLRHVTVIEEAHRLLKNLPENSPAAHSIDLFASLLAEVRAYGEGVVIAEQIPSKIIPDVIKNTALKIVHRLPAADDREALGATMNLSDAQSEYIVTLRPGTAAVFVDGMDRPLLAAMSSGEVREDASAAVRLPPLASSGRRSPTCAGDCRSGVPCTVTQLRHAEQLLDSQPALSFWMEISFAAHAVGLTAPGLSRTYYTEKLRRAVTADPRGVHCAIAHAAERALMTRYGALREYFDPESLAVHLAEVAWTCLNGGSAIEQCADDRGRWRAGRQRFADLSPSFWSSEQTNSAVLAPAEVLLRAAERGVELVSDDPVQQARQLKAMPWFEVRDQAQRTLLVGRDTPSCLMVAAAAIAGAQPAADQLLLASQRTLTWPNLTIPKILLPQLQPPQPESRSSP